MSGLDKPLDAFDFEQLTASDFGKDKLVKLIIKIGDGIKKSELSTRDVCMEYLQKLKDSLTVKDLAGVVNSPVSSSMVALMKYQFEAPPVAAESEQPEPLALEIPAIVPAAAPTVVKMEEAENELNSSVESGELNEKPANLSKTSDTGSTSSSRETWKCMENLLEKLTKVAISSEKDNQPASMPPVYNLEDNPISFKKFCYTELARWFRFEKIPDSGRREYFAYAFNDEEFAKKVETFVQDETALGETYDYIIDAISEQVEDHVGIMQERRDDRDRVEEFNELNNTAWEICNSREATPRQSLSSAPTTTDPEVEDIQKRVAAMQLEQERLKAMQCEIENVIPGASGPGKFPTLEEKIEADIRSVFVGQVDYACSAAEVEAHFRPCGMLNRVTILCDKYTYHPKGFAYVEFAEAGCAQKALTLDGSYLKGRALRVLPKRTNNPTFKVQKKHGFKPRHSHAGVFKPVNNYY